MIVPRQTGRIAVYKWGTSAYLVLVGVGGHGVSHSLASGLLAVGLHARPGRVHGALDLVTSLLQSRLLGVGLRRMSSE